MKKKFSRILSVAICVSVLSGCGIFPSKQDSNTPSVKVDGNTSSQNSSSSSDNSSNNTTNTTTDNTSTKAVSFSTEDESQTNDGILGNLPDITYNYEDIVNYPKGVVLDPRIGHYSQSPVESAKVYSTLIKKQFENVPPLPENPTSEQVDHLFKQLLYVVGSNYPQVEPINRWSYIVFKKDGVNPVTGKSLSEDVQVNLEIVLDASGSMNTVINGKTMMQIAKESINKVLSSLPPNTKVGLRVFGHKGDNTKSGRDESCSANELIVPIEKLNTKTIKTALDSIQPKGWTSIAKSIENGTKDLSKFTDKKDLNILYIVTDGIETCGGDPKLAAASLKDSQSKVVLGIIGFNVDSQQNQLLQQIAKAGGGVYSSAEESASLTRELSRIHELAVSKYDWKPLDDTMISKLKSNQSSGLSGNKTLCDLLSIEELNNIRSALLDITDDNLKIVKYDSPVYKKIFWGVNDRKNKIDEIYKQIYEQRKKESEAYIAEVSKRKGQMAALVPTTSTMDLFSPYYIPQSKR